MYLCSLSRKLTRFAVVGAAQRVAQPLEFLVAGEVNYDPAAAAAAFADVDLRTQRDPQLLF